ncbi:hypothetical protein Dsin_009102 [Dipteronia sinensis]|uniref:Uncharacterized protein n=1 Tax=Dipteronia sinensis TaxID=43782 RepID=A0AAE0AQB5_9ROSI|nr:hypothetical protein Dsin_009102 [Dipteronia sinensis]
MWSGGKGYHSRCCLLRHEFKTHQRQWWKGYNGWVVMEYSFEEETDFSDSEFTEYAEKQYEDLKADKYKVNVKGRLRCLFCPGKKKQD